MERRYGQSTKSSSLPHDYLEMIREVFTTNFDAGLKALAKLKPEPEFLVNGNVYAEEIVLSVTLSHPKELAAITAYASVDFDPKASAPTAQDLLAACVDVLGSCFEQVLNPDHPERLARLTSESLAAAEDIPLVWTRVEMDRHRVYVKFDKANPKLDQMADEWLAKHDPQKMEREQEEQAETEKLFVTGPKKKDNLH